MAVMTGAPLHGATIGSYVVRQEIGNGGMGTVYLAEHTMLGRRAAIKVLLPEMSANQEMVKRFFNEARAASAIKNPGIVEIYDFGYHTDGSAYIVMELLEGESLSHRLRRFRALPVPQALTVARQIASALAPAHRAGIVHRDLKPDNIFLVPDSEAASGERTKILDFGIAKLSGEGLGGNTNLTAMQTVMGSPHYMSPEQCRGGSSVVDGRSDLYALGCILFECIAGRPPFLGETFVELMGAHLHVAPPPLTSIISALPFEVESMVMRMLAKSPAQRFQSAEELAAALNQGLGQLRAHGSAPMPPGAAAMHLPPGMPMATPGSMARPVPTPMPMPSPPGSVQPMPGASGSTPPTPRLDMPTQIAPGTPMPRQALTPGPIRVPTPGPMQVMTSGPMPVMPRGGAAQPAASGGRSLMVIVAAVALLIGVAVGLLMVFLSNDDPPASPPADDPSVLAQPPASTGATGAAPPAVVVAEAGSPLAVDAAPAAPDAGAALLDATAAAATAASTATDAAIVDTSMLNKEQQRALREERRRKKAEAEAEAAAAAAAATAAAAAAAAIPATLSVGAQNAGYDAVVGHIKSCAAGKHDIPSGATVFVLIEVLPSGKVREARITSSNSQALSSCVVSSIIRATFQKTEKGGTFRKFFQHH